MKIRKSYRGLVLLLVLFGCSSVEITKVPSKTQYSSWDDEQQRRVDSIKGVRYYMPRPYVNVYEPFLVNSTSYIVSGNVSADGSIRLNELKPGAPEELRDLIGIYLSSKVILGTSTIIGEQGSEADDGAPASTPTSTEKEDKSGVETSKPGKDKLTVTNNNKAFAITPLRRYYDVVYLPDFDEQYAVSRK